MLFERTKCLYCHQYFNYIRDLRCHLKTVHKLELDDESVISIVSQSNNQKCTTKENCTWLCKIC